MKTKTIYHLDHDCNIIRIEVIKKKEKSSYCSLTQEEIETFFKESRSGVTLQDEIQKQHQYSFQKTPIQKELSIDQLRDKLFPNCDNSNKIQELMLLIHRQTKEVREAVRSFEQTDKDNRRQYERNLRRVARRVSYQAQELVDILERHLLKNQKK